MVQTLKDIATLSPTKRALFEVLLKEKGLKVSRIEKILRQGQSQTFPLSFAQTRVWFLEQLEPGNPVYNETTTVKLKGRLNQVILEQSLHEIIRRHEILRTVFTTDQSEPVQRILPFQSVNLSLIDLSEIDSAQKEEELQKISSKTVLQPFDLKTGPLLRASLFKLNETEHILLLVLHHIATDGWSSRILIKEMMAVYEAYCTGTPAPLKELPVQYADFAVWQRNWLQGEVLDKQITYWKQQLGGKLPVLELPHDYPRPTTQTFHAGRESIILSTSFTEALHKLSQDSGATLFMTLLSAFKILLYRLTGLEDIIVGSPIAGRNRAEIEGLIGFFINTLALRTEVVGNLTFPELLANVRKVALNAYNYQDMPFEKLVEVLQPERDLSRTAIFQVFFNLLNFDQNNIELPELSVETLPRPEQEAKFDLTLYAREKSDGLQLEFVYKSDLFKPERIQEMLAQLQRLLEQIVENAERPINSYSLVTPTAQNFLPDPTLELPQPAYELIPATLQTWIQQTPTTPAIRQYGRSWSYAELGNSIHSIVQTLLELGLQPGETVAVTGERSFGLIAGIASVLCSGGVLLTLAQNLPKDRYRLMLEQAKAKYVLIAGTPPTQLELYASVQIITLDPQTGQVTENLDVTSQVEWPVIHPDDPAYLFFTSGTTGIPKGVLGCHKGLAHFLTWQRQTFQVGPKDRNAQLTGLSFDVVLRDIFLPLSSGATLCLPDEEDLTPGRILPWMEQEQITLLHTVPSLAASWLMSVPKGVTLASLRQIFCAGEPLTNTLVQQWRDAFPQAGEIVNIYGPTETTLAKCFYRVPAHLAPGVQPVGTTLPETQALVLDANHQRCGIGEPGEIVIRTPFRSLGYVNASTENQSRFFPNPYRHDDQDLLYHTGDRGRYRPDGLLEILGRVDHQVKIRGVRIEPGEIQAVLAQHPEVQQTVVVAREDNPSDKRLVAYVVLHPSETQQAESLVTSSLRTFLKQKLPEYMVPSAFVILDKIPLTPNGKVDRRALPTPEYDASAQTNNFIAPRNNVESRLAEIWQQVLGVNTISVTDNFFDVGGHSLLAVQLFAKIGAAFHQELPLATLFHAPTIEQLATLLGSDRSKVAEIAGSALVPLKTGQKRPFFCVHTIGGHLLRYNDLARHLDPDQPVYGLQSVGLDGRQRPYFSVEAMAAHYIREMRTIQPAGPYLLGGASFGGKVAYEMARQLMESGEEVAVLAMFDTYAGKLSSSSDTIQQKGSRHLKRLLELSPPEKLKYIWRWLSIRFKDKSQKFKWQFMKLACQMYEQAGQPLPPALREFHVLQANLHARQVYKSHPYAGSITLFRATEAQEVLANHPLLGWDRIVTGPIYTYDCPGHHISMIFEPHVTILAKQLQACLDDVANGKK
jgi:amino acid adenylation domain-containing protein